MESFARRLASLQEKVAVAARRSGRPPEAVRIVAVTKTVDPERIREAIGAGLTQFGENRVQEARAKISEVGPGATWHLVGHLQRNKGKEAARLFEMIHSVDSAELLRDLDRHAVARERRLEVLVQVSLAGEATKSGVEPGRLAGLLEEAAGLTRVAVVGLMTMPPYHPDPEKSRPYFRILSGLAKSMEKEHLGNVSFRELSMGMTEDFEVAVEEGATLIRIGRALFGERPAREAKEHP